MIVAKDLALDIDGVLCNFSEGVINKAHEFGLGAAFPCCWREVKGWNICNKFQEVMKDLWRDPDFWLNLNPIPGAPRNIKPQFYLTARPVDSLTSIRWLRRNGFPKAPVHTVSKPEEKLEFLKSRGLWLIDDYYETINSCIKEGVEAYLFKAPYQVGHDVKHLPMVSTILEALELREGKNTLRRVS